MAPQAGQGPQGAGLSNSPRAPASTCPPSTGSRCPSLLSLGNWVSRLSCCGMSPPLPPQGVCGEVKGQPCAPGPGEAACPGPRCQSEMASRQLCRGLDVPGTIYILGLGLPEPRWSGGGVAESTAPVGRALAAQPGVVLTPSLGWQFACTWCGSCQGEGNQKLSALPAWAWTPFPQHMREPHA